MEYRTLGSTGISVSELCFGALTIGPLQSNISIQAGGELIVKALNEGINFIDTAEQYMTYDHIRYALNRFKGETVIASKSLQKSYSGMKKDIERSLHCLNREYLDIFHLHAARDSIEVFKERAGALECLNEYKKKGYIRATGISTHSVKVVEEASIKNEIDIIFPIINKIGRGILDGNKGEMIKAIKKAHNAGKGLYVMKVLVGGYLIGDLLSAIKYVRKIEGIDSIAIGMVSMEELVVNLKIFNDEDFEQQLVPKVSTKKLLVIDILCKQCGICVKVCPNYALTLSSCASAKVDYKKCILCGYCLPQCPELAIRII